MDKVIVVGAGVGGLCLAHALKRGGRDVVVLERAEGIRSNSTGVVIHARTVVGLREVGLENAVRLAGQEIEQACLLTRTGRVLASTSSAHSQRDFGAPSLALQGGELVDALIQAVGPDTVRTSFCVATYEEEIDRVVAIADDGRRVEGSVLVGADGTWSRIRSRLVGDGPPKYAGYTCWRGVAEAPDLVRPGTTTESWGRGQRFGIVSLARGQVYWFALSDARAGGRDGADPIDHLRRRFDGWHYPVDELLRRTEPRVVSRSDIHDRAPIRRWGDGRVVLLGDAAHPMTPDLAHGAGQAIEDAVALSRALLRHEAIIAAFREYEATRVDRANQLAWLSRNYGEIAQWKRPLPAFIRDAALRLAPGSLSPFNLFAI